MELNLRPEKECGYDAVSLGEVMLRLDPGEGRIRTARSFRAWEGGGEYNVVRGLRRCFGLKTGVITAFADNEVGMLMEDFILQGGVDTSLIKWMKTDGIGRTCRNGLNFTERGFGIRGAVGCSDRANTAISKATPEDFDFEHIFGELGVRWLHTGGIYAALSEQSCETVLAAIKTAKKYGTVISLKGLPVQAHGHRSGKAGLQPPHLPVSHQAGQLRVGDMEALLVLPQDGKDFQSPQLRHQADVQKAVVHLGQGGPLVAPAVVAPVAAKEQQCLGADGRLLVQPNFRRLPQGAEEGVKDGELVGHRAGNPRHPPEEGHIVGHVGVQAAVTEVHRRPPAKFHQVQDRKSVV